MSAPLRVLILEDAPADAQLMLEELRHAGSEAVWQRVETDAEYLACLDPAPDLILADYILPQFDALRALCLMQERGLDIPFIVVTGAVSEEVAVECMKLGASDYLLKDRLARLGPAVIQALEQKKLREEKQRAEKNLRESEARFRALIENATDLILVLNPDNTLRYVSPSAERLLGFASEEIVGRSIADFVHPDDLPAALEAIAIRTQTSGVADQSSEFRVRHKDGSYRTMEAIGDNLLDNPAVSGIVVNARDITERKQAEEALSESHAQLAGIIASAMDAIITIDPEQRIIGFNAAAEKMFGYPAANAIGQPLALLLPERFRGTHREQFAGFGEDGKTTRTMEDLPTLAAVRANGQEFPVEISISRVDVAGRRLYTAIVRDITERKLAEEELRYLSTHDSLTGLYNRAFFEEEMSRLEHGRQFPVSVVMVDVDDLKGTNDSQGHAAGDELLRQAADVLRAVFRAADVVARIGGDEFALLLPGADASVTQQALERLRSNLANYNATPSGFPLSLSIGTATVIQGSSLKDALKQADEDMYRKKNGLRGLP